MDEEHVDASKNKSTALRFVVIFFIIVLAIGFYISKNSFKMGRSSKATLNTPTPVIFWPPANSTLDAGPQPIMWSVPAVTGVTITKYGLQINQNIEGTSTFGDCASSSGSANLNDVCTLLPAKVDDRNRYIYKMSNFEAGKQYRIKVFSYDQDNDVSSIATRDVMNVKAPLITGLTPTGISNYVFPARISWNPVMGATGYSVTVDDRTGFTSDVGPCIWGQAGDTDLCPPAVLVSSYDIPATKLLAGRLHTIQVTALLGTTPLKDPMTGEVIRATNYVSMVLPPPTGLNFTPVLPAVGTKMVVTGSTATVPAGKNTINWNQISGLNTKLSTNQIGGYRYLGGYYLSISDNANNPDGGCGGGQYDVCKKNFGGGATILDTYNFLGGHTYTVKLFSHADYRTGSGALIAYNVSDPVIYTINVNNVTAIPKGDPLTSSPPSFSFTPVAPAVGTKVYGPSTNITAGQNTIAWTKAQGQFTGYLLSINDVTNPATDSAMVDTCSAVGSKSPGTGTIANAPGSNGACVVFANTTVLNYIYSFLQNHKYNIKLAAYIVTTDNISPTSVIADNVTVKPVIAVPRGIAPSSSFSFTPVAPATGVKVFGLSNPPAHIPAGKNTIAWTAPIDPSYSGYVFSINDTTTATDSPVIDTCSDLVNSGVPMIPVSGAATSAISVPVAAGSSGSCIVFRPSSLTTKATAISYVHNFIGSHTYNLKLVAYLVNVYSNVSTAAPLLSGDILVDSVVATPIVAPAVPFKFSPVAPVVGTLLNPGPNIPAGKNTIAWAKPVGKLTGYLLSINDTNMGTTSTDACSTVGTKAPTVFTSILVGKDACMIIPSAATVALTAAQAYNFLGGHKYNIKLYGYIGATDNPSVLLATKDININNINAAPISSLIFSPVAPAVSQTGVVPIIGSVIPAGINQVTWTKPAGTLTGYLLSINDTNMGTTTTDACSTIGTRVVTAVTKILTGKDACVIIPTATTLSYTGYNFLGGHKYNLKLYGYISATDNSSAVLVSKDIEVNSVFIPGNFVAPVSPFALVGGVAAAKPITWTAPAKPVSGYLLSINKSTSTDQDACDPVPAASTTYCKIITTGTTYSFTTFVFAKGTYNLKLYSYMVDKTNLSAPILLDNVVIQ